VLLGRSGCGKSTLLRLLSGEELPDEGSISVPEGWHPILLSPAPYVLSFTNLLHNVMLSVGAGTAPSERETYARELLAAVGLSEYADLTPNGLSTGMKQRLGLARVLAGKHELLLLDEPFAALDFITREELQQLLLSLQAESPRTMVLVTHQLDEALTLGDSITVLQTTGRPVHFDLSCYPKPRSLDAPALKAIAAQIREACRI